MDSQDHPISPPLSYFDTIVWKKICRALCSRSILCSPHLSLVAVKECGNWIVLFCHCHFDIYTQTSKKLVVFFFHQTLEEHWAYIWFLSSSRIVCTWASMLIPHWLITTIIITIIIIISYFLFVLSLITASFSPQPYWNNIPNILKVPRWGGGRHISKLPKLLHISSELVKAGEILAIYGGGGGSTIKHTLLAQKRGTFLYLLWVRRHSLGWGWVLRGPI
jgi:hypothetical protein